MISIRCMVVWKSFFLAVTLIAAIGVTGEGQNLSVYASMLASPERRQQYRDEISKRLNELKSAIQNSASIAAQSNLPEQGNGRDIFNRYVKPQKYSVEKAAAAYILLGRFDSKPTRSNGLSLLKIGRRTPDCLAPHSCRRLAG